MIDNASGCYRWTFPAMMVAGFVLSILAALFLPDVTAAGPSWLCGLFGGILLGAGFFGLLLMGD